MQQTSENALLSWDVFVTPGIPIVTRDRPPDVGEAHFQAMASTSLTVSAAVPLGRLAKPKEIARAVVFLASGDSSYITGTELFVGGGFAQV